MRRFDIGGNSVRCCRPMMLALLATGLLAAMAPPGTPPLPQVHLVYQRDATAQDCPDAETVQDAVKGRLGFDPFAASAGIEIRANVVRQGDELRATLEMTGDDSMPGERRLSSRRSDCSELAAAMELALSIAIDPLAIARQPDPTAAPAPAPPPRPPAPAAETQPSPPREPRAVEAGLGVLGSLGAAPAAILGFSAGAGVRAPRWSLSLEGRVDLPGSRGAGGGSVSAFSATAALVPCLHASRAGACLLATAGALRASGHDLANARQVTTLHVAVGARALFEVWNSGPFGLRLHVDLLSPLTRSVLKVGDAEAWSSSPVSVAAGIIGSIRFK